MSIGRVDRFLEEACGSSKREMGPTKEIVVAYSTEEGGPGWVACADMEKSELLPCSCEIIGTACSCLCDRWRPALFGCDCVMQWYHVEVTGWVFISGEYNLPLLGNIHGCRTKVDGAPMSAELRHRHKGGGVYVIELMTSTCPLWQLTEVEAISCLCVHGATIGASYSDIGGGILVVGAVVVCWDKVVSGSTI